MMQSIDNPQPMYIPTRISPDVVASSRQLIPLGTVEMGGKSYYKFNTGCEWYKAVAYYPVSIIRSINQMSENDVNETEVEVVETVEAEPVASEQPFSHYSVRRTRGEPLLDTARKIKAEIDAEDKAAKEAQAEAAPVVEPEVESEPGAKIVRWYANSVKDRLWAETEIAALEAKGWIFRGISSVSGSDEWDGEYSVLYVRPQVAVSS